MKKKDIVFDSLYLFNSFSIGLKNYLNIKYSLCSLTCCKFGYMYAIRFRLATGNDGCRFTSSVFWIVNRPTRAKLKSRTVN